MDAQTVINTTMSIVQQIAVLLAPAAKASYEAATIGAKMIALQGMMSDVGYLIFGAFAMLIGIGAWTCLCCIDWKKMEKGEAKDFLQLACFMLGLIPLLVGIIVICCNIGDFIFQWTLFDHPDAALAYTLMNKIAGANP